MPVVKKKLDIRAKGANAERDIATDLNAIIFGVMTSLNYSDNELNNRNYFVQRNQNQSAVGGQDLVNTYGFAIEVKRQETLSINSWWDQCVTSASNLNEIPVLLFKQNKQKWRCITHVYMELPNDTLGKMRGEIDYATFLNVFRSFVVDRLKR